MFCCRADEDHGGEVGGPEVLVAGAHGFLEEEEGFVGKGGAEGVGLVFELAV